MKKAMRIVSVTLLVCFLSLSFFGCDRTYENDLISGLSDSDERYTWEEKWKGMISERNDEIKVIMIHIDYLSSDLIDLEPAYFTSEQDIDTVLDYVKDVKFEKLPQDFSKEGSDVGIGSGALHITVINDTKLVKDAKGEEIYNETGTYYKNAIRIHISRDGYVYVVDTTNSENPVSLGEYSGDVIFKSKTTVDYNALRKLRGDNVREITTEEYNEIFGY